MLRLYISLTIVGFFNHPLVAKDSSIEVLTVQGAQTKADIEDAEINRLLSKVPGGVNLINLDNISTSQASLSKVLNFEPGIVVQEFFGGNDQPRINIRGSGIQDNPVNRGIQLLEDGLPLNQSDGSFIIGLIDPEQSKYIIVYRGANAMRYGATTLGGAINFIPRTADNASSSVKLEVGSFGLKKLGLNLTHTTANWAAFISGNHSQITGFRNHSDGQRNNFNINFSTGAKNWQNRSYIKYSHNKFNMPFLLNKETALSDPDSIMGENDSPMDTLLNIGIRKPNRDTRSFRIANNTRFQSSLYHHKLGIYAEQLDDNFRNPLTETQTHSKNIGLEYTLDFSYYNDQEQATLFTHFVSLNSGSMPRDYFTVNPVDGQLLPLFASTAQESVNQVIGSEIISEFGLNWQTVMSLQWVKNKRKLNDLLNPGILDSQFSYQALNPKIGLIYSPDLEQRYYTNYSASSESPNFWQLATVASNPNDPLNTHLFVNDLKMQTAKTFELGAVIEQENLKWQASYYYSKVKKELISVVDDFAVNGKTINYVGLTLHQGFEAGFTLLTANQISYKFVYNYSDFKFKTGLYEGNLIAGIPRQLLQTEINYTPTAKLSLAVDLRWQMQTTYVDHMNTPSEQQPAFALFGIKASYQPDKQANLFLEIKNVTNKTYQTAYAIRGQTAPGSPTFIPGSGISLVSGIQYKW